MLFLLLFTFKALFDIIILEEGDTMILNTIIKNSNIFTDENLSNDSLISIANKGIARINTELGTKFPEYKTATEEYTAFPASWQLDLISNYMSYGVKMNDSSLSEANMYLDEFYRILNNLKDKLGTLVDNYIAGDVTNGISPEYIETEGFGGVYGIDTSGAINVGFFGDMGNGGCF